MDWPQGPQQDAVGRRAGSGEMRVGKTGQRNFGVLCAQPLGTCVRVLLVGGALRACVLLRVGTLCLFR